MVKREEICLILKNIFKCDSISFCGKTYYEMKETLFVLKKDGENYGVSIDNGMIQEIPSKNVAEYISERYINLMIYGMDRSD